MHQILISTHIIRIADLEGVIWHHLAVLTWGGLTAVSLALLFRSSPTLPRLVRLKHVNKTSATVELSRSLYLLPRPSQLRPSHLLALTPSTSFSPCSL